jgi:hypothetical protein
MKRLTVFMILFAITGYFYAQTARVQVIHNSADAAVEFVDVYLNEDLLIPDFGFRTASSFIDAPAGVEIVLSVAPLSVIPPPSAVVSVGVSTLPNSIFLSSTVNVVESILVVVPETVRLPAIVTSSGNPIVIVPELSPTSTSLFVPEPLRLIY